MIIEVLVIMGYAWLRTLKAYFSMADRVFTLP
jgi:hypothetical protein